MIWWVNTRRLSLGEEELQITFQWPKRFLGTTTETPGHHVQCGIKVDLMKAYNYVRWDLIFLVSNSFGFSPRFMKWVEECITKTKFSIRINGALCRFFSGQRALRQGDLLSQYLCVW